MNAGHDTIFDGMASFLEDIYGTTKGDVRLHVLWQDLLTAIPALSAGGLRIIDVGAGIGEIANKVAELGHEVTLCDPSHEMLEKARTSIHEAGLSHTVRFVESAAQELQDKCVGQFDVVMCHAVLEWLADPKEGLSGLLSLLNPDGYLSLMFYNRNAAILKRVLRGEHIGALKESKADSENDQRPVSLEPDVVQSWLIGSGLHVHSKAGIRIFHDHLPEQFRRPGELEELLQMETEFRKREPFASLAQHIHFVCRRK